MKNIEISDATQRRLMFLKNHWSFTHRKITNEEILNKLQAIKKEIFGYDNDATSDEIEKISIEKSREQLENESERFQRAYRTLLNSGHDFEPEYTMDKHLQKMIDLIEDSDEIGAPLFD